MLPKYMVRRENGVYGLRFDVPKRLQSLKRRKIVVSLGTTDLELALGLFRREKARLDQLIAAAEAAALAAPRPLTSVERQATMRQMVELRLEQLRENPPEPVWHPVDPSVREEVIVEEGEWAADWTDGCEHLSRVEGAKFLHLQFEIASMARAEQAGEPPDEKRWLPVKRQVDLLVDEAQQALGRVWSDQDEPFIGLAWQQAMAHAAEMAAHRAQDWSKFKEWSADLETLPPPGEVLAQRKQKPKPKGVLIGELIDSWAKVRQPAPRQIRSTRQIADELVRLTGKAAAGEINADDARQFRDYRLGKVKPQTVHGNLRRLSTVWRFGIEEELLKDAGDPWVKVLKTVKPKQGDVLERVPFSDEEIRLLLRKAESLPTNAERWSWPVCLFTGLRPEEFACLRGQDLVAIDGIKSMEIRHEAQTRGRAKTASSERTIPLPAVLLRMGFWEWATTTRTFEKGYLLELTATATTPNRSNTLQSLNSLSLRGWGITDPRKPFYSCRHSFNSRCVAAGLPDRMTQALMGHSSTGMTQRYSGAYSLKQLKEAIDRVEWPM